MNKLTPYIFTKRAGKALLKIRKTDKGLYEKINDAITNICLDPYSGEAKRGDLKGFFSLDIFHQGTNYELCYTIKEDENGNLIVIILVGTREDFYSELKRYLGL